jgi:hypothetical protein
MAPNYIVARMDFDYYISAMQEDTMAIPCLPKTRYTFLLFPCRITNTLLGKTLTESTVYKLFAFIYIFINYVSIRDICYK